MDAKQYRVELAALLDQAHELTAKLHALMDKIPGGDPAGTTEWNFVYALSRSANGITDTLYQTLYPKASAFGDDEDALEAAHEAEMERKQQAHDEMINDKLAEDGRWG